MKNLAKVALTLIAARLLYWPTKAVIAWAYNRMIPDIDWDAIEDDGFITEYHSRPIADYSFWLGREA